MEVDDDDDDDGGISGHVLLQKAQDSERIHWVLWEPFSHSVFPVDRYKSVQRIARLCLLHLTLRILTPRHLLDVLFSTLTADLTTLLRYEQYHEFYGFVFRELISHNTLHWTLNDNVEGNIVYPRNTLGA